MCHSNFGDFRLKLSEASFFGRFSTVDNFRLEVYSDVMSGAIVDLTGKVCVKKIGDSRSHSSRDIRLPHFVTNDDDNDNDKTKTVTPADGPYGNTVCLKITKQQNRMRAV